MHNLFLLQIVHITYAQMDVDSNMAGWDDQQ